MSNTINSLDQKRALYIPQKAMVVRDKLSSAIAYLYENNDGEPCLRIFAGKRSKPDVNYRFIGKERRNKYVEDFFKSIRKSEALAKERRKPKPRLLVVGDILYSSWGYDQTNVGFYQVVELVGKTSVKLRKIASSMEALEGMSGKVSAVKDNFIGQPFKVRANGDCCKVDYGQHARKWDGTSKYCSWYH